MKKKLLFIMIFVLFIFPCEAFAASAISITKSPSGNVYVGDKVTITISASSDKKICGLNYNIYYDDEKLELDDYSSTFPQGVAEGNPSGVKTSYYWVFTAKSSGVASFSISDVDAFDNDGQELTMNSPSTSIEIKTPPAPSNNGGGNSGGSNGGGSSTPTPEYHYSEDNNLSSLNIEGFDLSFDSGITEYSITVPNETKKVKIGATANDGKASVSGIGEYDVKEGNNDIEIVVTAENGDKKTYKVTVVVKELSPIEVEFDGNKYSVVRKSDKLPSANSTYKASSILIKGETVPCYHSEITDIYLIGLMNDKGEIALYSYDASKDKFSNYNEINVSGLFIALIDTNDNLKGYSNGTVKIGEKEYNGFVKEGSYPVLYGINLETGEKNYYNYDPSENTLQKYSGSVSVKNDNTFYIIVGLASLCLFEFFMIILSVVSKNKQLKKILHSKLDQKTEYEKSYEESRNKTYDDEDNITDDLTDEYMSSESTEDSEQEEAEETETEEVDETETEENVDSDNESVEDDNTSSLEETDEYNLGHTALISRDLNNVFNNSVNKKELKKREKLMKKRKNKNNDDEMFKF